MLSQLLLLISRMTGPEMARRCFDKQLLARCILCELTRYKLARHRLRQLLPTRGLQLLLTSRLLHRSTRRRRSRSLRARGLQLLLTRVSKLRCVRVPPAVVWLATSLDPARDLFLRNQELHLPSTRGSNNGVLLLLQSCLLR